MGDSLAIGDASAAMYSGQPQPRAAQSESTETAAHSSEAGAAGDRTVDAARNDKKSENENPAVDPVNFARRYELKLDKETGQVFTDIVDPRTDAVVGRIPSYFKPSEESENGGHGSTPGAGVTV